MAVQDAGKMTSGPIAPALVTFTIPLVLGNLFQLTYNAVDSVVVGRYVGADALAAVGTSNPLMTLAILLINGLCLGAGVLVSTAYGAGDTAGLRRQISTTAIGGFVFSLAFSAFCILMTGPLLYLLQVPQEVQSLAQSYLRIVFAGLIFTFFYNFLASTMRALGDSKSALYFLMFSAVLNVFGDLFFVVLLRKGVMGCAFSTVLSELVCCILCVVYISLKVPVLCLGKDWFVFDASLLRKTVEYGWASAMQQSTVQIGKIIIQAVVNSMGVNVMAAFAAAGRIDDFAYIPEQNIGHAMTTAIAQNRGAGENKRVAAFFHWGIRIEIIYAIAASLICFFFAEPLMRLFVEDDAVIAEGVKFLHMIALVLFMPGFTNGIQGGFRGFGKMKVTLTSSTLNMVGRVGGVVLLVFVFHFGIEALPFGYVVGWIFMLVYETPMLLRILKSFSNADDPHAMDDIAD